MPHQCVRCAKLYPSGCKELLMGCECGGKFFFFVKEEAIEKAKELTQNLTIEEKQELEEDILQLVGNVDHEQAIILDFESIRVTSPGKYEIDLIDLFKGDPLVIKLEEGKYIIDIPSTFHAEMKKKK
ncbi:MAG: Zn-ribbon containing protein [bacterium]|nr:Zn-ribbon containing protein [bacterium]